MNDELRAELEEAWGHPPSGMVQLNWPSLEEQESFNTWLADALEAAEGVTPSLRKPHTLRDLAIATSVALRDRLCPIYSQYKPILETDGFKVATAVADGLISAGMRLPLPVGNLSIYIVKNRVLDRVCGGRE